MVVCDTISKNGGFRSNGKIVCTSLNFTLIFLFSRPRNAKELFNPRHAQLRNVVERIFGIVKRRWSLFTRPQEYLIETQARFVCTIGALHNFIRIHDAADDAQDLVSNPPHLATPLRREDSLLS
jgi:hypothetical protein